MEIWWLNARSLMGGWFLAAEFPGAGDGGGLVGDVHAFQHLSGELEAHVLGHGFAVFVGEESILAGEPGMSSDGGHGEAFVLVYAHHAAEEGGCVVGYSVP